MRSVWSRVGSGSIDAGLARRVEPGEQHRRLHLRRRHRQAVGRSAAGSARRSPPAAAGRRRGRGTRAPMRDSGSVTRAIGRRRSEASPVKKAVNGWVASDAQQQPRAGAGIAEIEHVLGLGEAADADARRPASTPSAVALDRRRPARASRRRCAARPRLRAARVISVRPTASAPRIRARCEIDLSPGTATAPAERRRRAGGGERGRLQGR